MNKSTETFEKIIKAYLDRYALRDEVFAEKYRKTIEVKTIKNCCEYIASEVKKMNVCGLDDSEVFGLAIHYYDEGTVIYEKTSYQVVCNQAVELTEEEKAEAKAQAIRDYQKKVIEEYASRGASKKKEEPKPTNNAQLSLF